MNEQGTRRKDQFPYDKWNWHNSANWAFKTDKCPSDR